MPSRRAAATLVALAVMLAVIVVASTRFGPRFPEEREVTVDELVAGIEVSARPTASTLAATHAIADFGLDGGVRLVLVRIVDELAVSLTITSARDVSFVGAPRFCLVGPYSAPDDAGLEDPCWGEPDLGSVAGRQLSTDPTGHPMLQAGRTVTISAELRRGDVRCDYPPGAWVLEVRADPLVDGMPAGPRYLPDAAIEVPLEPSGADPLPLIVRTRYCGLANQIYRDQGEPAVESPAP